ncbi:MAG: DNA recombination protein RmuC [Elusimicrobia bacterium]|nr:DNA recombination protein RmuC [Elusimicrobiota bacterium]
MEFIFGLIGLLAGGFFGFFIARHSFKPISEEKDRLFQENKQKDAAILELERKAATYEAERKALDERLKSQKEEIAGLQAQMKTQFENIANSILSLNSEKFEKTTGQRLTTIVEPLREQIKEFQKKIEEEHRHASNERATLKGEVSAFAELNKQLSRQAENLTTALRGNVKAQGNWGEMMLKKILEASGLREGEEYVEQARGMGLTDEEGGLPRPDFIINLPEKKHIVIDSKVSLVDYERYVSETEEKARQAHLKNLVDSFRAHIKGLAEKNYQDLYGITTLDFVLMFVPLESALSVVLQEDKDLLVYAWDKKIFIVGPTTLLATLRTVARTWQSERQVKNALAIAKQGGSLYDKFAGLLEDLKGIGESISASRSIYEGAVKKIAEGKGNLISQVEKLKKLGVKATKSLPQNLVSDSDGDSQDDETAAAPKAVSKNGDVVK